MFENFPKSRPPLPDEYQKIFEKHYTENREGGSTASSFAKRLESWMHRKVAEDIKNEKEPMSTLEIGAGTLNHLPYEPHTKPYDVVEPWSYLLEQSSSLTCVRKIYQDVKDIPLGVTYERIISVATFEHILDLPNVVSMIGLMLKDGGQLRVGIPSEGTVLWRIAQTTTTGLEFRLRHGLDYRILTRYDHVNDAAEIEQILKYFFSNIKCSVFGLSRKLSLYQFFSCSVPLLERCHSYLDSLANSKKNDNE